MVPIPYYGRVSLGFAVMTGVYLYQPAEVKWVILMVFATVLVLTSPRWVGLRR